jgi:hypothetical protein
MWLMVYHPFQRIDGGSSLPQEIRDRLFQTSVENVEYSLLLENEDRTKKWGWLFRTYVQWHAIAFLLSELCVRTEGESVERAWKAIDFVLNRRFVDDSSYASHSSNKMKSHLWKPMKRLMDRAKAERAKAIVKAQEEQRAKTQAQKQAQIQTSVSAFDPAVPIMNMDFSVDRLFPGRPIGDAATPLPDMSLDMTGFSLSSASAPGLNFPTASPPVSVDQIMSPIQNDMPDVSTGAFPTEFGISDDWLSNNLAETSPIGTSALLPDGSVNWANWDDMVNQYGMQVDSNPPVESGQPGPYNSTFPSLSQWY